MTLGKSYLPDIIMAMLFPVMADYASKITALTYSLPQSNKVTEKSYKSISDKAVRSHKNHLREGVYEIFKSKRFIRKFPQMKEVEELDYPPYQKCIIMLAGLDIEPVGIGDILQTSIDSILSLRSKRSEEIERIFGRKSWMKK